MHVDPDDLATLAIDPAAAGPEVHQHVAGCASCHSQHDELQALARSLRRSRDDGPLESPPDDVRHRIMREVTGDQPVTGGSVVPLVAPRRRGVPLWAAGTAAAVALVAGLGIGLLAAGPGSTPEPAPPELVASTDLTSLERADPRGLARAVRAAGTAGSGDVVTLQVDAEALGGRPGIHEVWLLNLDGTRMIAVGLLAVGDEGEFEVPAALLDDGYRIVDISVEPDDGDPTHSGVSLARGELA